MLLLKITLLVSMIALPWVASGSYHHQWRYMVEQMQRKPLKTNVTRKKPPVGGLNSLVLLKTKPPRRNFLLQVLWSAAEVRKWENTATPGSMAPNPVFRSSALKAASTREMTRVVPLSTASHQESCLSTAWRLLKSMKVFGTFFLFRALMVPVEPSIWYN